MERYKRFALDTYAFLLCLTALSISDASALSFDWVQVNSGGNAPDHTGFGSVGYRYRISQTEVTVSQYAAFLNSAAQDNEDGLYHPGMGVWHGLNQSGASGTYSYSVTTGREQEAIGHISFENALRFVNWLENGSSSVSTNQGAYDLSGGLVYDGSISRQSSATFFLPSEDEWYKAAYFDPASGSYFEYPTGTNVAGSCSTPTSNPNSANCGGAVSGSPVNVGSYPGSASPLGTLDQGGNVWEWNETFLLGDPGGLRGGGNGSNQATGPWGDMRASYRGGGSPPPQPGAVDIAYGFRVASVIPEPGTALLLGLGLAALAVRRGE